VTTTTTPPPVEPNNTIRLELEVVNLNTETCLCQYKSAEQEVGGVLLTPAYIISCGEIECFNFSCKCPEKIVQNISDGLNMTNTSNTNSTSNVTSNTTRRLLQVSEDVTNVQMVYQDNGVEVTDEQLNSALVRAYNNNQTFIRRINRQRLNLKGISWDVEELFRKFLQALESNMMLFIIVGAAGAGAIIIIIVFVLIFVVFKDEVFPKNSIPTPTPPIKTQRVLNLKINSKIT